MAGTGAKWFRYGCFGCVGLVGVVILACAALFTVAWMGVQSEEVERRTLTPEISTVEISEEAAGPGTIFVEVSQAELVVDRAEPGESLRAEATYDAKAYEFVENLQPGATEGEPWSYRLELRRTSGGGWTAGLKQLLGGSSPHVHLYLPPDLPFALNVVVMQGGSTMQLGGLSLTSADIDVQQGGLDLRVDEPLLQPAERISISTSMGGGYLGDLGNASPKTLELRYSMGGMTADLRGRWVNDSDITIDGSMGGGSIWLPDDVIFEGLDRGGIEAPADPELKPPTLRFAVTSAMGDIQFID